MASGGTPVWFQKTIQVTAPKRGCHYITKHVTGIKELSNIKIGLCNLFIKHTSASITVCESWDGQKRRGRQRAGVSGEDDVRKDMETILNRLVPEDAKYK